MLIKLLILFPVRNSLTVRIVNNLLHKKIKINVVPPSEIKAIRTMNILKSEIMTVQAVCNTGSSLVSLCLIKKFSLYYYY